ncbi:MAG TPA: alcohol dehydrogenase catalytic domain-containing protein [Frankiaceae bacterium]|nr:alcohol dehydrogenase catalytic domain-containing protein [Frankiaceae bacterium]
MIFDGRSLDLVTDLDVPDPGPHDVTVRVLASGICHSDLNVIDGTVPVPPPVVLGHEGAGVIERLGAEVEGWSVGDSVAVIGLSACGRCRACLSGHPTACVDAYRPRTPGLARRGAPVRSYANVASFAERITLPATQLVDAAGIPPAAACLIGCALTTGFGVVNNVARVAPGERVAVIGMGGIGAVAVQAARLAGAEVTAIDVRADRADIAKTFGAAAFCGPADVTETFDTVIECSGAASAIDAAIDLTAEGGVTALVGLPPAGYRASFDVGRLMRGRRILGSLNGDIEPSRDLPAIVEHVRCGRLSAEALVTRTWPLEQIEDAIAAARSGAVIRAVLTF